jgi:hypothetical protein
MQINHKDAAQAKLSVNGKEIMIVDDFKYLGSYIMSVKKEVKNRIALAWVAFTRLKKLLTSPLPKPDVNFRVRLLNAACLSVLLYGCETWTLTAKLEAELDIFARKCYRAMLRIKQAETHTTNQELYARVKQQPVSSTIRRRQLQFVGHCLRMEESEPAHIYAVYLSEVRDKNRRGRPRTAYRDVIIKHIKNYNSSVPSKQQIMFKNNITLENQLIVIARNKSLWKKITEVHTRGPDQ